MKTTSTLIALSLSAFSAFSQLVNYTSLEANQMRARINNNGIFFNKRSEQSAGFEVPKGTGIHAIYAMNIMAGGKDVNGQLKLAATDDVNSDFFFGPVTELQSQYNTQSYIDRYSVLWAVSKSEVDNHIANWQTSGYQVPENLQDWPGNGNVQNGESALLAPFFDRDNDEIYEPADGDYPLIRGDKAVFCILNDTKNVHPLGGDPIGIEVHLLFYQYDLPGALETTTFLHSTVINRGTQTLSDFHFGSMVDFDLGGYNDDYIGTDIQKNIAYVYNGDAADENESGILGYGIHAPAVGVMTLNKPLNSHISPAISAYPETAMEHYNLLTGKYGDGDNLLDDNSSITRYAYYGGENGWSEFAPTGSGSLANAPGNRISYIAFPDEILNPGAVKFYDCAVVYARDTTEDNIFGSLDDLLGDAAAVQDFYNSQDYGIGENEVLSLDKETMKSLLIYPNPVTDAFIISGVISATFEILTIEGKKVSSGEISNSAINVSALKPGSYILIVNENGVRSKTKLIKQ